MKLTTYRYQQQEQFGLLHGNEVFPFQSIALTLPHNMLHFLEGGAGTMELTLRVQEEIMQGMYSESAIPLTEVQLLAPIPRPTSFRDAYAFRQHVATSRRNRGLEMIPEFDQFPVFYFSNHLAINGPGAIAAMPLHFEQMDFELEVAVLVNKQGRNIPASKADEYIAGYMIMNDLSARKLQMEEMKLNLGPAKGKDFATAIGPYLVTKDELAPYLCQTAAGHVGDCYNLDMSCQVNGIEVSRGNFADMHWTFAEIIERISYGVDIYPGDLIGSGTVGTGCFLELNGTGKLNNPDYQAQWLQPDDRIELTVTGLGSLSNTVNLHK